MFFYLRDAKEKGKFVEVRICTKFRSIRDADRFAEFVQQSLVVSLPIAQRVSHVVYVIVSPIVSRYSRYRR